MSINKYVTQSSLVLIDHPLILLKLWFEALFYIESRMLWRFFPSADSLEVLHVPWIQAVLNPSCAKALWRSCLLPHEQLLQEVSLFPYHFTMSMDTAKFFNSSRQNKNIQENCFKDELISLFLEKEIIFS